MSKILKSIEMDLTPASIAQAIKDIELFKEQLTESIGELVEKLTEEGVEVAKMQLASMDAVYTGELEGSMMGYYSPNLRTGFVYTGKYYALFVEYGTGIVGDGTYPTTTADGWQYDIHDHGNKGWVYLNDNDGQFHWTRGYVARPFMLNTFEWLKEAAPELASEMWTQM